MPKAVVLARHPQGAVTPEDFALVDGETPSVKDGWFLIKNRVISLDSGFRQWMNAGAGDNYLEGMKLGEPVQSIVLGEVIESKNSDFPVGAIINARTAWEEYSVLDGSDLCTIVDVAPDLPLAEYMSTLGPTGVTAWLGLVNVGQPKPTDTVVVSAAGGAVGTVVGQLAVEMGCRTIGLVSSKEKADWIKESVGFTEAISREEGELEELLPTVAPDGVDLFFDNVGGGTLDTVMGHLAEGARLVLCGAISQYENDVQPLTRSWELITKRARMEGFMFSDYVEEFPAVMKELEARLRSGSLKTFDQRYQGIECTAQAFCDMMHGASRGKCLVELEA